MSKEKAKNKKKKDPILKRRFPRPLGTTSLSLQLQQENNKDKYQKLLNKIQRNMIEQYVAQGMYFNNKQVSIPEFASFLNMNSTTLIKEMNTEMGKVGKFFQGEDGKQLTRVLFLQAIFGALESQSLAKSQLHILMADQGQHYVPFLSAEVNRAITNTINGQKPLMDLLKLMADKTPENPLIHNTQIQQTNTYITADEALKILQSQESQSMLMDPNLMTQMMAKLNEERVPNVNAKSQDLRSIGIRYTPTENEELGTHSDPRERNKDIDEAQTIE